MDIYHANLKHGFTLLETVVALAILSAAIVGPMSLVSGGITNLRISKNRTIASYLAEEGMEVVRGIKENNALAGKTESSGSCNEGAGSMQWDDGLCPGAWRANISPLALEPGAGDPILFDPGRSGSPGLYHYQSGKPTIFTRRIAIVSLTSPADDERDVMSGVIIPAGDIADVTVTVSWREGFTTRDFILRERFYNWR